MNFKFTFALLSLLSTVSLGLSVEESPDAPITIVKRIDVEEYDKLRSNTNHVLLDVRSAAEFEKGRIPGATNIDFNSSQFAAKVAALDTNKTYLVNCAVGMRSAKACQKMETMGFNKLYDLRSGFDGWKKAGKPIEK
ncbi:MAG: rhodanese-like domain-containing protein [Verrucomicrobiota bacterium]